MCACVCAFPLGLVQLHRVGAVGMDPRIPNNVSAVEEDKITLEALREEHEMRRAVVFFSFFLLE